MATYRNRNDDTIIRESEFKPKKLVYNKFKTKAQYDAIQNPSDTELYLVPDVIDTTPTSGSDNMVTSGGVYDAINTALGDIETILDSI